MDQKPNSKALQFLLFVLLSPVKESKILVFLSFFFCNFLLFNAPLLAAFSPCTDAPGMIGGKAFQDFNFNGEDDQVSAGIAGVEVYIYGSDENGNSQIIATTTTDAAGNYVFTNLKDGNTYRVEFHLPSNLPYAQSGFNGTDSRTRVQFAQSPNCQINIGLSKPIDYCEADPSLAIPCFVNGDPLAAGSGSADEEALVIFKSSYENGNPKPTKLATASQIGSTWGIAYQKKNKRLLVASFLKRHVGLGPLGLGGIYQVDLSGPQPITSPFIDVNSIGINVGTYPSNSSRGLTANISLPNNDTQAFTDVGKKGLGGICISDDGNRLYLVNLTQNNLHSIDISDDQLTNADVTTFPLPNPNCSGGNFRPYAVTMQDGKIYVGGVCDAETSGQQSDLSGIVYRLDGNTFTEVLNFDLDYIKGKASRTCDDFRGWFPWTKTLPPTCFNDIIVYPTPQLSAIEFDVYGNMILGFTDRTGNQLGFLNYPPEGTDQTYSVFTGGDILKAGKDADGNFVIENNGTAGATTTDGAGNGEGPGGGEFYHWDVYDIAPGVPRPHSETAQGGLAAIKGTGQIISTALDPFGTTVNSGGVNYFNNKTGVVRDPGYRVFRSGASSPASFSKANGLGDLTTVCEDAPMEIGGRLWVDANENGIQDPNEAIVENIQVDLYDSEGTLQASTTSDGNGEYYFNDNSGSATSLKPNTDYYIVIGKGGQFNTSNSILLDSLVLTKANLGMGNEPDLNDSDANFATGNQFSDDLKGFPIIAIQTGKVGFVAHDNDAGFFIKKVLPKANISGFVWMDSNENGLQNNEEIGIAEVVVALYAKEDNLVKEVNTGSDGNYRFENIESGEYYLVFDPRNANSGSKLKVTLQDVGDNELIDSDIPPSTGRVDFVFEPLDGDKAFDAGYILPTAPVIGVIFNDVNQDGLQDAGEPNIGGVTIHLFDADGNLIETTTSAANGTYQFDGIEAGDYYIEVDISTNSANIPNFQGTILNAGDDNLDSDVHPNTGLSDVFSHNPADGNSVIDAGFYEPNSSITGYVWFDENANGLQENGEQGIAEVEVRLLNEAGAELDKTNTNNAGNYIFSNIKTNRYTLVFTVNHLPDVGDNYKVTQQDIGNDDALDSDIRPTDGRIDFEFDAQNGNVSFDAGYILPKAAISGLAFEDANEDGLRGVEEGFIEGVTVKLFNGDDTEIASTQTDINGAYLFDDLLEGHYYVTFDISTNVFGVRNYVATIQDAGDDAIDSDIDPNTEKTASILLNPEEGNKTFDAGYYIGTGTLTGLVFHDLNENGLQDGDEPRFGGVEIEVVLADGSIINGVTAATTGTFSIEGIPSGDIQVFFDPANASTDLEGLMPTIKDVNNNQNDDIDSDINNSKATDPFTFIAANGGKVDAGFFMPNDPVFIGDFVFKDCNKDGIQDEDEVGIPNILVTLTGTNRLGKAVQMETTSNKDGYYSFMLAQSGTYSLDFDIPSDVAGLDFSPNKQGNNEALDSDANPISGVIGPFTLESGANRKDLDVGLIDNAAPFIFNVPPDVTVDCNDIPSLPTTIKGVDNCDPSVEVIFEEKIINPNACPYVIERTWTAYDDCGNSSQRTQRITVEDTKAPLITVKHPLLVGLPNDGELIFDCDNMPEFKVTDVEAIDDCSEVQIEFVDLVREQGDCLEEGYIAKMICGWEAKDACGNTSNFNIVIFVVDTKAPDLLNIPDDITVNLDQNEAIPSIATVIGTDNCDESVRITYEETHQDGVCGSEIIRTWKGFDDCGNKTIKSQKITLIEDCTCPDKLVDTSLVWDAACDESTLGMIQLALTADLNKYDISISPNLGKRSLVGNSFTDLPPGDYRVTVNYSALESCTEYYDFTIKMAVPGAIQVVSQTQADCFQANGKVVLAPADYSYEWSDGGTGAERNDLAAGEYIVTFTDANQCKGSQVIIIGAPDNCECIDFKANVLWEILPTCPDYTNGQVDIEVMGGKQPYTYQWQDGQTTKDYFSASAGPYSLTITDANGCTTHLSGELVEPSPISVIETVMNGKCGQKGAIDLYVSGGTAPFAYTWSNGEISEDLSGLETGTYTVSVTDANDCLAVLTFNIQNQGAIQIDLNPKHPTCSDGTDGAIEAFVSGGTAPYTFEWSHGEKTKDIGNLAAGVYALMVTDASGCKISAETTLEAPSSLNLEANTTAADCSGDIGSIHIAVNGGIAPYTYAWDHGATTANLDNLAAGIYNVTITDANACSITASYEVADDCECPEDLVNQNMVTDARCGEANGRIMIMVNGDLSHYQFDWSPNIGEEGATKNERINLPAGDYEVTVTFANKSACSKVIRISIGDKEAELGSIKEIIPATCGEAKGQVILNSGVTYIWPDGSQSQNRSGLAAGTYGLKVRDASGCKSKLEVTIPTDTCIIICDLEADIHIKKEPDCKGNLGKLDLIVTGGTAPFEYHWNNELTGEDQDGLIGGVYSVTVIDANGCTAEATADISKPDCNTNSCDVKASLQTINVNCPGYQTGAIKVVVHTGTEPFSYLWSNGERTSEISSLAVGEYWVEVTDAKGCVVKESITITAPEPMQVVETKTVINCEKTVVKLDITGGIAPYHWSCEGQSGEIADPIDLPAGTYQCIITDGAGCQISHYLVVEAHQPLAIDASLKHTTCNKEDGKIDLIITGGTAPYTYEWNQDLLPLEDQFELKSGTYIVTVTDANACVITDSFIIKNCANAAFGFITTTATSVGDRKVKLTWEAKNETTKGNYLVLHSTDGANFEVMGFSMKGKGTATSQYEMDELGKLGKNYFQIKYIDEFGTSFFSEKMELLVEIPAAQATKSIPAVVYPNPTAASFTLDFAIPVEKSIKVTISDVNGIVLKQAEIAVGASKEVYDLQHFDAGIYNIILIQKG
jgi:hypothetical protein